MLRDMERVQLRITSLHPSTGGSSIVVRPERTIIYVDKRLSQRERRAAVAHELTHLIRGLPPMDWPPHLRDKEEAKVRQETAEWLVPRSALLAWAAARCDLDPIDTHAVMEEFNVPRDVAAEAMRLVA